MFSVIIPLYNKEKYIHNTIKSVLEQNIIDFEIIVINDGSTDKSYDIVKSIDDKRLKIINQENKGVSSARNLGIKQAKFDWIALLDADDIWHNNHLSEIKNMIDTYPDSLVFSTSWLLSSNDTKDTNKKEPTIYKVENYYKEAIKKNITNSSVIVVHKDCFKKSGLFNEKICRGEDLDMWARLADHFTFVKSERITAVYNRGVENSLTSEISDLNESLLSTINLKGLEGDKRKYFKRRILIRLKLSIKKLRLKDIFTLINLHGIELLK